MITQLEDALQRQLTNSERQYINWLLGWDKETIETAGKLHADLYAAGQADANLAQQAIERGERLD